MNRKDPRAPSARPVPPTAWRSTGVPAPNLTGGYALPPGGNGDLNRRNLLAAAVAALYSAVGSAQRAPVSEDVQLHAVHQMVVANGALAASEADALLRLISVGVEAAAQVHLRALGEMTCRIVLCREYPHLAVRLYETAAPAWNKLAARVGIEPSPEYEKSDKNLRQLEQAPEFKAARDDVISRFHLLSRDEWEFYSKRSHGDIFALVDVSNNLRNRDGDVYKAVNKIMPEQIAANVLLNRGTGFAVASLLHLADEFGMTGERHILAAAKAYENMQEHDAKSGALRIFRDEGQQGSEDG